ncbi:hypothetical protein JCM33374_g1654 [Metschnikowia sp. JCM 33374]|nr:hypothetical protein JCM33374_g1654 [Metschnikowia sp. JCM 33374]
MQMRGWLYLAANRMGPEVQQLTTTVSEPEAPLEKKAPTKTAVFSEKSEGVEAPEPEICEKSAFNNADLEMGGEKKPVVIWSNGRRAIEFLVGMVVMTFFVGLYVTCNLKSIESESVWRQLPIEDPKEWVNLFSAMKYLKAYRNKLIWQQSVGVGGVAVFAQLTYFFGFLMNVLFKRKDEAIRNGQTDRWLYALLAWGCAIVFAVVSAVFFAADVFIINREKSAITSALQSYARVQNTRF